MLKKRIVAWLTGLALIAAVAGAAGVVADTLTASEGTAIACNASGSSGGGC